MAKVEATYGTDAAPVGGTDDVLTFDSSIVASPRAERIQFSPHKASMTKTTDVIAQRWVETSMKFWMDGSGTLANTAINGFTGKAALLTSCGCTVTSTANTNILIKPSTVAALSAANTSSATIWADHNGYVHKVTGALGSAVMRGTPRTGCEVTYRGQGKYVIPAATAASFANFTGGTNRARPGIGIACTINNGATYGNPVVQSFEFDLGNEVQRVDDMNDATGMYGFITTNRRPTLRMTFATDMSATAADILYSEWYTDWFSSGPTTHAVAFTYGAGLTGNSVAFSFPTAQVVGINYGVTNGIRTTTVEYNVQHATAETEWVITITSA
jgi:hypothetical protein